MDIKEYAALVERMRTAQEEHTRTMAYFALNLKKKLQKEVDEATESILGPDRIKNQTELF